MFRSQGSNQIINFSQEMFTTKMKFQAHFNSNIMGNYDWFHLSKFGLGSIVDFSNPEARAPTSAEYALCWLAWRTTRFEGQILIGFKVIFWLTLLEM